MIPKVQIAINSANNFGLTAFLSMIREGKDKVVTAIMKDRTVPSCAPLPRSASATGIEPKISPYMGMPTSVAKTTPSGFFPPKIVCIQVSGIQL